MNDPIAPPLSPPLPASTPASTPASAARPLGAARPAGPALVYLACLGAALMVGMACEFLGGVRAAAVLGAGVVALLGMRDFRVLAVAVAFLLPYVPTWFLSEGVAGQSGQRIVALVMLLTIKQATKVANFSMKAVADSTIVLSKGMNAKGGVVIELIDNDGETTATVTDGSPALVNAVFEALRASI